MVMRYLPGLGVGHVYAHSTSTDLEDSDSNTGDIPESAPGPDGGGEEGKGTVHESKGELEVDESEDHEDEMREEEEDREEEEEDFDTGDDYTDDETVYSETGSDDSGEY